MPAAKFPHPGDLRPPAAQRISRQRLANELGLAAPAGLGKLTEPQRRFTIEIGPSS